MSQSKISNFWKRHEPSSSSQLEQPPLTKKLKINNQLPTSLNDSVIKMPNLPCHKRINSVLDSGDNLKPNNETKTDINAKINEKEILIENKIINYTSENKDNENLIESEENKKSQAQIRVFDTIWLSMYPWLRYDKTTQLMTCEICIKYGKSNSFTKGCTRKRIDVLNEHIAITSHIEAIKDEVESKRSKELFDKALEKSESNNFIMLKISYFIAQFNLSFTIYPKLCDLIFRDVYKLLGVSLKNDKNYENDKMLKQYIESISYVIEEKLILRAIKSPYFSLLFDESRTQRKLSN